MKIENGFWFCECGLRAEHKASIGWACPDHGVAGYKTPKVVGCLVCGFRTEDENEIKEFQLNGCKCVARSKREWQNNCCEGCFQPLRDCLCDEQVGCGACGEMISVEDQDENGFHDPELCPAQDEIEGE